MNLTPLMNTLALQLRMLWDMTGTRVRDGIGGGLVGTMIGALVVIVIFTALAPVVAGNVAGADTANFTNGSAALFGLTTLFFVILGIVGVIRLVRA